MENREQAEMEQNKKTSNCIGIVGLGLIGGSLGLDLQALGYQVHGLVHQSKTLERAHARGLAQVISTDPKILASCDLIILALPIDQLLKPTQSLINSLPQSAVLTDVGSVKVPVLKIWRKLHPRFVASHPMAGTANSGVESGLQNLFRNKPWIATPEQNTDTEALQTVHRLARELGSHWITADAEMHDQAVALVSHLPVLVSAALLKTVQNESNSSLLTLAQEIASSGFTDTTRIGGGNPTLGTAMMKNNTSAILDTLTNYRRNLEELEKSIISKDWLKIQNELQETQNFRPSFLKS